MTKSQRTIIFDWNRTIFDPESGSLDPAAADVLSMLRIRRYQLILLTRYEQGREDLINSSELRGAFDDVIIVDRKSVEGLRAYLAEKKIRASTCVMVGDRVREEIAIGNALGMRTIWLRTGKFSIEVPRDHPEIPMNTIVSLSDLLSLLK